MKRKRIIRIILLLGVTVGLVASAGNSLARPRRSHDGRSSSLTRVYENGMLIGFDFPYSVDDGEFAVFNRVVGDQYVPLREESASGHEKIPQGLFEENFFGKWSLIRWEEPIYPSPPLNLNSDEILLVDYLEHDKTQRTLNVGGTPEDCLDEQGQAEYHGQEWLISDECRVSEAAPAPSGYSYCTTDDSNHDGLVETIDFPADLDIFDLDVIMHVTGITETSRVNASLSSPDGSSIKLFSEPDEVTNNAIGTSCVDGGGYAVDDEYGEYDHDKSVVPATDQKPDERLTTFSSHPADGLWTLSVENGNIQCWCLDMLAYPTVRFAQSGYTAEEGGGHAEVLVELSQIPDGTVTVDFAARPAPGSDQQPYHEELIFSSDDDKKYGIVVKVPLVDDNRPENDETMALSLSDPQGEYGLSSRSQATLTIENDDAGEIPPPTGSSPTIFVPMISAYNDFATLAASPASEAAADDFKTWQELDNSGDGDSISHSHRDSGFPVVASDVFGRPYVAWEGLVKKSDGRLDYEIFVKRWNGSSWEELGSSGSGNGISDNPGRSRRPSIAIDANAIPYVAWEDNDSGRSQIYVKRYNPSTDKWDSVGKTSGDGASNSKHQSLHVSIAIAPYRSYGYWQALGNRESIPYIAYWDQASPSAKSEVYVKRFNEDAAAWEGIGNNGSAVNVSNSAGNSGRPSIFVARKYDQDVYVAWHDDTHTGKFDIYLKKWDGQNWTGVAGSADSGGISNSNYKSIYSTIVVDSDDNIYVAWSESTSGAEQIYFKQYNGTSWRGMVNPSSPDNISKSSGASLRPSMSIGKQDLPYLVWEDESGGNSEIYSIYWNGSSWTNLGSAPPSGGVSDNHDISERPFISYGVNGVPYVVWMDGPDGDRDVHLRWWKWWHD